MKQGIEFENKVANALVEGERFFHEMNNFEQELKIALCNLIRFKKVNDFCHSIILESQKITEFLSSLEKEQIDEVIDYLSSEFKSFTICVEKDCVRMYPESSFKRKSIFKCSLGLKISYYLAKRKLNLSFEKLEKLPYKKLNLIAYLKICELECLNLRESIDSAILETLKQNKFYKEISVNRDIPEIDPRIMLMTINDEYNSEESDVIYEFFWSIEHYTSPIKVYHNRILSFIIKKKIG